MSLVLITAPAGSGKTQFVLEQIRAQCERNPLLRILVIVPSSAQLIGLRQRWGALTACAFDVTLTDFHTLHRDLLDTAGILPRQLPETARYRILCAIICQLATTDQLHYFASLAEKPGFIGAVSVCSRNSKQVQPYPNSLLNLLPHHAHAISPRFTRHTKHFCAKITLPIAKEWAGSHAKHSKPIRA